MLRKATIIVAALAMLLAASAPLLAQAQGTGDAPAYRPAPDDPYRLIISGDQAVYCGEQGVIGDPVIDYCIENGIVPPVLYDANGNLVSGSASPVGTVQYDNAR